MIRADAEVLLCAGAVQSPHILQLSGIGDPEELSAHGVPVVHALKGVGANLQDHLDVTLSWVCPQPITAYSMRKGLIKTLGVGLNYMLFGKGAGRQNFLESGAFLRSRPDLDRPDLQVHTVLAIMQDHGKVQVAKDGFAAVERRGLTLRVGQLATVDVDLPVARRQLSLRFGHFSTGRAGCMDRFFDQ